MQNPEQEFGPENLLETTMEQVDVVRPTGEKEFTIVNVKNHVEVAVVEYPPEITPTPGDSGDPGDSPSGQFTTFARIHKLIHLADIKVKEIGDEIKFVEEFRNRQKTSFDNLQRDMIKVVHDKRNQASIVPPEKRASIPAFSGVLPKTFLEVEKSFCKSAEEFQAFVSTLQEVLRKLQKQKDPDVHTIFEWAKGSEAGRSWPHLSAHYKGVPMLSAQIKLADQVQEADYRIIVLSTQKKTIESFQEQLQNCGTGTGRYNAAHFQSRTTIVPNKFVVPICRILTFPVI